MIYNIYIWLKGRIMYMDFVNIITIIKVSIVLFYYIVIGNIVYRIADYIGNRIHFVGILRTVGDKLLKTKK